MSKFHLRMRELRISRKLSQQELADCLDISKSSVNMYERGEREPGLDTLAAMADFFNVSVDFLLGRDEQKPCKCPEDLQSLDCATDGAVLTTDKKYEIGKRIKQRREELKMTQEELGKALWLNKSTIQRYETGNISKIKTVVIRAMASHLNVDPDWLMLGTEDTTPQPESYGQRLRELREKMGLTQDELAQRAGFKNRASISKAETGDNGIPLKKIELIAKALNVTPAYLLGWEKGENAPAPSNNIKKLRLQHSMTQAEFGAIAGVSDKAVSTWEQELKNPRKNAIMKLARHFGVSPAWLEGYTDDPTK